MIIFGWGRQTIKKIGILFKHLCNNCHNEEYWVLTRITTWFTIFFIPVIPYSTKYFFSCPTCQYGVTLDQKQVEEMEPLAELNQLLVDGYVTPEEYGNRLKQLNTEPSSGAVDLDLVETKTLVNGNASSTYCSNCGSMIEENIRFCGDCGAKATSN